MLSPIEILKRQWTLSTHRIHTLPVLVLMPHEGCNCRCGMCDLWKTGGDRREISSEQLAELLPALRRWNTRRVILSGGEALLHSDLWGLCRVLERVPASCTLLTNGILLRHHAQEVARWCDEVIVSVDGAWETHDAIRGIARAYDLLADGVAALRSVMPRLRITGRCTIQRRNYREISAIIEAARGMGLDQISFLAADVSSEAFNRTTPWGCERVSDVALSIEEVGEFRRVLEEAIAEHRGDFASGFVAESPGKLRRLATYFDAVAGQGRFPANRCNAPWVSTVIEADGMVRPCFFHRPLGNLHERPLEDILNSEEAIAFRRNLDIGRDPICERCVCTLYLGPRRIM